MRLHDAPTDSDPRRQPGDTRTLVDWLLWRTRQRERIRACRILLDLRAHDYRAGLQPVIDAILGGDDDRA